MRMMSALVVPASRAASSMSAHCLSDNRTGIVRLCGSSDGGRPLGRPVGFRGILRLVSAFVVEGGGPR